MSALDLLIVFRRCDLPAGLLPVLRQRNGADDILARRDDAA